MYTTPRKVKQESRLRRSHSLTNSIALTHIMDTINSNTDSGTIDGAFEAFSPDDDPSSSIFSYTNQKFPPAIPTAAHSDENASSLQAILSNQHQISQVQHLQHQLNGHAHGHGASGISTSDSTVYCSRNPRAEDTLYRTHSTKFPIVREVSLRTREDLKSPAEDTNRLEEKALIAQKNRILEHEQKALTLDSSTAKKFQQKLQAHPTATIRRNSLDLEKFIQVFNEEQILMSSMQGRHLSESGGVDSPKMFDSYNGIGNGGVAYYNDSNSTNSLSLSSSTADSLDTVIYKTPISSHSVMGPSRNWREQMYTESTAIQIEQHQQNPRVKNNGFEPNNQFQDQQYSAQLQQGSMSMLPQQQQSQYNGHNTFGLEYGPSSQSQQQQQMQHLSVAPSPHSPHPNSHTNGPTASLRAGNGPTNGSNINAYNPPSNSQSPNSPYTKDKQLFSSSGPSSNTLDKTKENSKLFHTKTYNHIKDMISSRFTSGTGSGSPAIQNNVKGVLSSASAAAAANLNNTAPTNGIVYNNGMTESANNIGLPSTSSYNHHHNGPMTLGHSHGSGHGSYALQVTNGHGPPFYVVPQNASPESYGSGTGSGSAPGQSSFPVSNSYRSPQMSERKDVNTSFRKAIQQSTQKSNLSEQSLQLRKSVTDSAQLQQMYDDQGSQFYGTEFSQPGQGQGGQGTGQAGGHIERANRALDKLLDPDMNPTQDGGGVSAMNYRLAQLRGYSTQAQENQGSKNTRKNLIDTTVPVISKPKGCHVNFDPKTSGHGQQNVQNAPLGLPVLPLVRENGDGSSVTIEGLGSGIDVGSVDPGRGHNGLQVLSLSPGQGQTENASSSSECEVKGGQRVGSGQSHTTTDSGLGTVVLTKSPQHSGNTNEQLDGHHVKFNDNNAESISSGNDSEWVDIVEPEIRQILELERLKKAGKISSTTGSSSLHVLQPGQGRRSTTDNMAQSSSHSMEKISKESVEHDCAKESSSPKLPKKFDLITYNKKSSHEVVPGPSSGQGSSPNHSPSKTKSSSAKNSTLLRSNSGSGQRSNPWATTSRQRLLLTDKGKAATISRKDLVSQTKAGKLTRNAMSQILYSLQDDAGEMTSTTGGLDLESMLDGRTEQTSEDDDLSTTIDTTDAHAIRRQLESLESMYTEVLKVLGGKKQMPGSRHPPPVNPDLRHARRRPYGSMSSLPSSVSSRPFRESRKRIEDKKKVKDIKSINRRFQRLESHVVTLARSVAHLSSEMRTQHLMVQEMEAVRNELTQLRNQVLKSAVQNQSAAAAFAAANGGGGVIGRGSNGRQGGVQGTDWTSFRNALPSLTNPCRVRKLTKFFGDEPPLIRIFLKKLGYEKYAFHFEQERIGIMELPYLTEERLQKMGIPMGPRLRILQEAHLCLKPGAQFTVETQHNGNPGNLSVYVV